MLRLLFLVLVATLPQQDFRPTAQAAEDAYQQGDYETASGLYESLVNMGINEATVYYNLGSTYYESGQLGGALINTLRAQQLNPRDPQINELLARIRTERIDFQGDEHNIIDRLAASTLSLFTLHELRWIALILWNLWFGLLIVALFSRNRRRILLQPAIVITALLAIVLLFLLPRLYTESIRPRAVVTTSSTEIMSGPGDDYLTLFRLYSAAEIHLLDEVGAWRRFALPDGRQGWIQIGHVQTIKRDNSESTE